MFVSGMINVFVSMCSRICIIWVENGIKPAILSHYLTVGCSALN